MIKKIISKDWYFQNVGRGYDPKVFTKVDLPHDYAMEKGRDPKNHFNTGHYEGGAGRYLKYIRFGKKEHTILDIDGAYMCTQVRFNDTLDAFHPNGYTPFLVDLTDHILENRNNQISILTDDLAVSSRWYSGAGIYRDVALWTGGDVRIEPWDLFVTTENATEDKAEITVHLEVSADYSCNAVLHLSLCGITKEIPVNCQKGKTALSERVTIQNPTLWEIDNPHLYTLTAEVFVGGEKTDEFVQNFGIREISFTAEKGFSLNGKSIKLQGGCIHHDHGGLGARAFRESEERKIRKLKEAGFNAVRISHNPPSTHLLNACDRLGMLVMDEAFDMWTGGKNPRDYHLFFRDWCERDVSYMVLRDRSHPSVISYSIGNEIPEADCRFDGGKWAKLLSDTIRKYDTTRAVTSGICGSWWKTEDFTPQDYTEYYYKFRGFENANDDNKTDIFFQHFNREYSDCLDIVGYNYKQKRYEDDLKAIPDRIIWGSETWTLTFFDSWSLVEKHPQIIGDFVWTAYDNIGETGAGRFEWDNPAEHLGDNLVLDEYPWRLCFQGDLDLAGFRRPQSYYREMFWRKDPKPRLFVTHPKYYGHAFTGTLWHWYDVRENWTFEDKYIGEKCEVQLYTLADEVVFYVNDKQAGRATPEKGVAKCDIQYQKGTLKAEVYRDGKKIDECVLESSKGAYKPKLTLDKTEIGDEVFYIEVELQDEDGRWTADNEREISALCSGGRILTMFSGQPNNKDNYSAGKCHTFMGRAVLVVKAEDDEISISVGGENLKTAEIKFSVK